MKEGPRPYRQYISWFMPAHDLSRPDMKGRGFIRSSAGGIVYSACPDDPEHHCKGKRRHCWSLRCPKCMNDTALKRGVQIEKQLLPYKALSEKKGIHGVASATGWSPLRRNWSRGSARPSRSSTTSASTSTTSWLFSVRQPGSPSSIHGARRNRSGSSPRTPHPLLRQDRHHCVQEGQPRMAHQEGARPREDP